MAGLALPPRRTALAAVALAGVLSLAACSSSGSTAAGASSPDTGQGSSAAADRPSVVAAFYPLEYVATQVGGDAVQVTSLTAPGIEPHDLELTAAQVAEIAQADLVLYIKGFQPAVDEAVEQQAPDRALDVSAALPLLGSDPHVWLDPANMATIADEVSARLAEVDPAQADAIGARARTLAEAMDRLDQEFTDGLATCRSRDLVVSHDAFAYLAAAYGFTQVGISGLAPDAEPSPARIKEVADLVREKGVTTVYYETLVDPKVAQTVADEAGAQTAVLDPLEGLTAGAAGDYASVMRANLDALRAGQGCT